MEELKKVLPNNIYSYVLFYFSAWIVHIILISMVAFFHFRLDHKLIVIENWIYDFAWQLILVSKLFTYALFNKYVYGDSIRSILTSLTDKNLRFNSNAMFLVVMLFGFLLWFTTPKNLNNFLMSELRLGGHFLSMLCIFIIDYFMLRKVSEQYMYPKVRLVLNFLTSTITFAYYYAVFPASSDSFAFLFLMIFGLYQFFFFYGQSIITYLTFLMGLFIPLCVFVGFDPIWASKFSYYKPSVGEGTLPLICFLSVTTVYHYIFNRKGVFDDE
jgi:hypothetical protein